MARENSDEPSKSSLKRMAATAVRQSYGDDMRWQGNGLYEYAEVSLPLLGGVSGGLTLWPDGVVCGSMESRWPVVQASRPEIGKIFERANTKHQETCWEFARRGRVCFRIKGVVLRGPPEAQLEMFLAGIFQCVAAMEKKIGSFLVQQALAYK